MRALTRSSTQHFAVMLFVATACVSMVVAPKATAATAPQSSSAPTVAGTARVGQALSSSNGTWTGTTPMTYTRRWRRCNSAGTTCSDIAAATGTSYTLVAGDGGSRIGVIVIAANSAGSTSALSALTAVVTTAPPVNTAPPTISGTPKAGTQLSASPGTWTGTGITYTYQWQRCTFGCATIAGATSSTYTPSGADVNASIKVVVKATNSGGNASATSAATATVVATPPTNTQPPSVSGTVTIGETLTGSNGSWSGAQSYALTWQRCNVGGTGCVNVAGATRADYLLRLADEGSTLRVSVTASGSGAVQPSR